MKSRQNEGGRLWALSSIGVFVVLVIIMGLAASASWAQEEEPPTWRRIRTNSVPYKPSNVAVDSAGDVWVTASEGTEYDPGVWRRPVDDPDGRFHHYTNDRANNYLVGGANNVVVKPELDADVLFVIRDGAGNIWYALNDRRVLCEKAGGGWETFNLRDTTYSEYVDTANIDSAHTIRLIDNPAGGQNALIIANMSISLVTPDFTWEELRYVYTTYNNDRIRDAFIDSQGRCWVANEYGVQVGPNFLNTEFPAAMAQYENDVEAPPYDPFDAAPVASAITGIEEDSNGNMWFVNGNDSGIHGAYCLKTDDDWVRYSLSSLGSSDKIYSMAAGPNGGMWFGPHYSGVVHYAGGVFTRTTCAELGLDSENVISMDDKDGVLWFVTDSSPNYGTGVHALTLSGRKALALQHTYEFRKSSTSLAENRIQAIAADRSGGVWFGAYDLPSVARMKADGTWVQYAEDTMDLLDDRGKGSITGIQTDSNNIVFIAPTRRNLIAYDVENETWVEGLPAVPGDPYVYSLYLDPEDGKWLLCSYAVYYLNPENDAWTTHDNSGAIKFPHESGYPSVFYVVYGALMDRKGNMWFGTQHGVALMEKDPEGGDPAWFQFQSGDASGYSSGYRVFMDGKGKIWNSAKQRFDFETRTWSSPADTTDFDKRPLLFDNGGVAANMNLDDAPAGVDYLDPALMTVDSAGNIYLAGGISGWVGSINMGIVARSPVIGDINRDARIEVDDAVLAVQSMSGMISGVQSAPVDVTGDGKVDSAETLWVLQVIADLRDPF